MKQIFCKRRYKSIKVIEYIQDRYLIRTSKKIEMKREIMKENESQFKLVYSSPIFDKSIIEQIGQFGQSEGV